MEGGSKGRYTNIFPEELQATPTSSRPDFVTVVAYFLQLARLERIAVEFLFLFRRSRNSLVSQGRAAWGTMKISRAGSLRELNQSCSCSSSAIKVWKSVGPGTQPESSGVPKISQRADLASIGRLTIARNAAMSSDCGFGSPKEHPQKRRRVAATRIRFSVFNSGFRFGYFRISTWRRGRRMFLASVNGFPKSCVRTHAVVVLAVAGCT